MATNTSEKVFQNDIIAHLVSTGYKKRCKDLAIRNSTAEFLKIIEPNTYSANIL